MALALTASTAALTPARPPPTMTTWAPAGVNGEWRMSLECIRKGAQGGDADSERAFLVRGVAELAVLLSLATRGAPAHHPRAQPREKQEVCDRVLQSQRKGKGKELGMLAVWSHAAWLHVLEGMACEDLQELP